MNGQLVQVCCPSGSSPELIDPVENSSREVVELRAEVEHLRRENLEFRQQVGYWKSRHRDALRRIAALEQQVEQLEGEKRQLQADLFGRRSETTPLKDRSNHLDDPQDDTQRPKRKRGQQPGNSGPQRRDYSSLPVREELRRTACRAMCLPRLRPTVAAPQGHGRLRTNRDRCPCLSPRDSPTTLSADLHLPGQSYPHGSTCSQADSQRPVRHFALGRDPPGQVFHLSAHRTLPDFLAVAGFGPGTWHHHRWLAAVGSPAAADLRGDQAAESSRGFASGR